jgi:hypothetical protein
MFVAFVDDQMPVVRHAVIDDALADEALDQGDINSAGEFLVPATEPADGFGGQVEKGGEALDPLF